MPEFGTEEYFRSAEYLELEPYIQESLLAHARVNISQSAGRIALLDVNPDEHPGQHGIVVESESFAADDSEPGRVPAKIVSAIASAVMPNFKKSVKLWTGNKEQRSYLEESLERIESGRNVVITTNHGDITDIALAEAAVVSAFGALRKEDKTFDVRNIPTGIVVNKMVAFVAFRFPHEAGFGEMDAVKVLQWLCNKTFLTFPATPTARKHRSRQIKGYVRQHNEAAVNSITEYLDNGGVILAVAPSGGRDSFDKSANIATMRRVNFKTAEMLCRDNTDILPIGAELHHGEPVLEICSPPRQLTEPGEIHDVMRLIAGRLNAAVEDKSYRY